jgi:hypothetical protein
MAIEDTNERTSDEIYLIARQINADFAGGVLVADVEEPHSSEHEDDI